MNQNPLPGNNHLTPEATLAQTRRLIDRFEGAVTAYLSTRIEVDGHDTREVQLNLDDPEGDHVVTQLVTSFAPGSLWVGRFERSADRLEAVAHIHGVIDGLQVYVVVPITTARNAGVEVPAKKEAARVG